MECTSFEHAGGFDKASQQELIQQVAQDVEADPDIPLTGPSQAAPAPTTAQRIASGSFQPFGKYYVMSQMYGLINIPLGWQPDCRMMARRLVMLRTSPIEV